MLAAALRPLQPDPGRLMLHSKRLDQLAIALSAVCIVHCLAVPVVVAFLPIAAVAFGTGAHFHELMLWLVVPTSVAGFGLGYRVHRNAGTVLTGIIGLAGIVTAGLWGHAAWSFAVEAGVSIVASFVLAIAHLRNFSEVRRCHTHR
jgi:uncharacterized membrane protein